MAACAWRSRISSPGCFLPKIRDGQRAGSRICGTTASTARLALDHKIPVHLTYFTAVVDGTGKVATFADLYGLDRKLATALFGNGTAPAHQNSEIKKPRVEEAGTSTPPALNPANIGVKTAFQGEMVQATWYGDEFRGSRTASGEVFNPDGLTAAHKSATLRHLSRGR